MPKHSNRAILKVPERKTCARVLNGNLKHLKSWRTLAAFITTSPAHETSLRWLLYAESCGLARPHMMRRIITRLATLERNRLYKLLKIKTK